ncbi:hypothetical protein WN944_006665 [Citrus x changshan-huyou]|uniref:Uncharacterized protein n=1 Tax=Citrus x changshan-huyou TaxID=2935761 RepID=A0AAP0QXD6_9ROSI
MIPTFQNLQQSSVDKNMYPHGVMDYSNGLMNLHHITGDNVYPTATQNSSTHPQLQPKCMDIFSGCFFSKIMNTELIGSLEVISKNSIFDAIIEHIQFDT